MNKILIAMVVTLSFNYGAFAGGFNDLKSALGSADIDNMNIPAAAAVKTIPASLKAALSFEMEAARCLREDLASSDIKAKVTLVEIPGGKIVLSVVFANWNDYEQIKDLFYQDPGDNPSYRSIKVLPSVARKENSEIKGR